MSGRRFWRLVPFFCLSITFGTTLGFLTGGAPLILRARGVELAQIGLLQLINLPVGLTFLWALAVDRTRLPVLPHRLGWIVAMQTAAIGLLVALSQGEAWPLAGLFLLAIAICFCVATMDVALEALVVETIGEDQRPLVVSAKFCGAALGTIIGAGLLIEQYASLGWQAAVLIVAGLNALCLVPILFYPETRARRGAALARAAGSLGRLRFLSARIGVIGLYFAALFVLTGANGLVLIDLGVPLARVGFVTGTIAPLVNIVMALAAGGLVRRYGTLRVITVGAAGAVAAAGLMLAAAALALPALAVAAAMAGLTAVAALGVPVFTMIYRWAQGPRAATDYALLFGAAFFAAMPLRVAAPALAAGLGWPAYFALAIPFYILAVAVLCAAIRRTEVEDRAPPLRMDEGRSADPSRFSSR